MDKMNIKLSSRFMKGIAQRLISKMIYDKFGYKVKIQLDDLDIKSIDGETDIHVNVNLKVNSDEFRKIMSDIGAN